MTPIERQILQGLTYLIQISPEDKGVDNMMFRKMWLNNMKKMNQEKSEEPCCEMPKRILTKEEEEELYNDGKSLFANVSKSEVKE